VLKIQIWRGEVAWEGIDVADVQRMSAAVALHPAGKERDERGEVMMDFPVGTRNKARDWRPVPKRCPQAWAYSALLHHTTRTAGTSPHTGLFSARLPVARAFLIRSSTHLASVRALM
jgi:hypothetical protein